MAKSRIDFQMILEDILGSKNVYFQPPSSIRMQYPAIRYQRDDISSKFADDLPYALAVRYLVTYIDPNPDSDVPMKLAQLRYSSYSTQYVKDNLNHTAFAVYY